jgi:hypothetical protein
LILDFNHLGLHAIRVEELPLGAGLRRIMERAVPDALAGSLPKGSSPQISPHRSQAV